MRTATTEETYQGLSQQEAAERLKKEGLNELASAKKRTFLNIALEVLHEPMFLLLIACGSLYLFLGDLQGALMLLSFVFVVIGITIYQERKVERALEALRDLSSPRARVIRDGVQKVIPGREVVREDIILLAEGDRVPADVVILSASNFMVDESLLTGESAPVRKATWDGEQKMERPGGEDLPFAYSSTLVSQGHAVVKVLSIGGATEVGKIGKALQTIEPEKTELQKETERLVKLFGGIGLLVCVLIIVMYGITRADWAGGLLVGLALAMAVLPEEFPVVLTIFLALGAWRMSRRNVLTRRMSAIQNLGSATVLCSDKTGTLTLNKMTLEKIWVDGKVALLRDKKPLPDWAHETMEYAILASQKEPYDPMERSIKETGAEKLSGTEHMHVDWELMREYPLSKKLLALSHVWREPAGNRHLVAAKGAPEAIFDLCHLTPREKERLMAGVALLSSEGLRVLGVAKAYFSLSPNRLPENQHDFEFKFSGLIALEDPVRAEVPEAVRECYDAGMRVIMITGDYSGTARMVAKNAGFVNYDDIITGAEMETMSEEHLRERIKTVSVFARVVPEQKLRIVEALKANNEVVVMTGDGVNDAPALKASGVGIAMGGRGTDVARESAALVLTDDNFASIVRAVRMGRAVYDNIKKAMAYIISVHMPIAGLSLIPVLFGWPIVLFPVHIAFLELIIDPVCSVVFEAEPEERNIMKRKPRKKSEPLFDREILLMSALRGLCALAIVALVYWSALNSGAGETYARAMAFTTLVFANLAMILSGRSQARTMLETLGNRNRALWIVVGITFVLLAVALYVPGMEQLFKLSALSAGEIGACAGYALVGIAPFEIAKVVKRARRGAA
ncbi:putative copper-exporting P-type ATPase A [Candidatus Gugararchaeum adminiculabundum]|nr:putative copper-exporting P-type ATPase A [Candidatus Gugararchaeum adminiculabundum]